MCIFLPQYCFCFQSHRSDSEMSTSHTNFYRYFSLRIQNSTRRKLQSRVSEPSQERVLHHTDQKILRIQQFNSLTKSDKTKVRMIYQTIYIKKLRFKFKKMKMKFQGCVSIHLNTFLSISNFSTQRTLYQWFSTMGPMDYPSGNLQKVTKATGDCHTFTTGCHTPLKKRTTTKGLQVKKKKKKIKVFSSQFNYCNNSILYYTWGLQGSLKVKLKIYLNSESSLALYSYTVLRDELL